MTLTEFGNMRSHCKRCGTFVGRTDEFGYCEKCRMIVESERERTPKPIGYSGIPQNRGGQNDRSINTVPVLQHRNGTVGGHQVVSFL